MTPFAKILETEDTLILVRKKCVFKHCLLEVAYSIEVSIQGPAYLHVLDFTHYVSTDITLLDALFDSLDSSNIKGYLAKNHIHI